MSTHDPDDAEWVLDVDMWQLKERNEIWILRHKNVDNNRYQPDDGTKNGRAFIFNKDGSISPRDEPTLFLGRIGSITPKFLDQMRLIHSIRKGDETFAIFDRSPHFYRGRGPCY